MLTRLHLYDPIGRDTSWITDELIVEYAASSLRSELSAQLCIDKWTRGDAAKAGMFAELIIGRPELEEIKDQLLDQYGEEAFVGKPRSLTFHIRQLEIRMEACRDPDSYAKLAKQLADMRGWNVKPVERAATPINNITVNNGPVLDASNPREAARIVMSVLANASAV